MEQRDVRQQLDEVYEDPGGRTASNTEERCDSREEDEPSCRSPHNHRDTIVSCHDMDARIELSDSDFERLLAFRNGLRRFLRWSEHQAKAAGLTGAQHQLLLAIRGSGEPPSIGDLAHQLLLRHHSVVELVNRAEAAGLVERLHHDADHRIVRIRLRNEGERKLALLSSTHLEELSRLRTQLSALWDDLPEGDA